MILSTKNAEEQFRNVIQDKELKTSLRKHLTRELSDEILSFLDAVDMFKETYDKKGAALSESIYELYIQRRSPHEINISSMNYYEIDKISIKGCLIKHMKM